MNNLPVIEVEEIEVRAKTQWELRLEENVKKSGKESAYSRDIKPTENKIKHIEWY